LLDFVIFASPFSSSLPLLLATEISDAGPLALSCFSCRADALREERAETCGDFDRDLDDDFALAADGSSNAKAGTSGFSSGGGLAASRARNESTQKPVACVKSVTEAMSSLESPCW
jgi:hypothetical protein